MGRASGHDQPAAGAVGNYLGISRLGGFEPAEMFPIKLLHERKQAGNFLRRAYIEKTSFPGGIGFGLHLGQELCPLVGQRHAAAQ